MSFLDNIIGSKEKQEGNLEEGNGEDSDFENKTENDFTDVPSDTTYVATDLESDAVEHSINICNEQELKKAMKYKKVVKPMAMSSTLSEIDMYSESTVLNDLSLTFSKSGERKPLGTLQPQANSSPFIKGVTTAGKKYLKRKFRPISLKPSLPLISEGETEDDEFEIDDPNLLSKKTKKALLAQKEQEDLHQRREERRKKIAEKVKNAAPKPPKFNDSKTPNSDNLERAVLEELERLKSERVEREPEKSDPNKLFFLALAGKVATLDQSTANAVTAQLWITVCKAQEEAVTRMVNKPVVSPSGFTVVPLTADQESIVDQLLQSEPERTLKENFGFSIKGYDLITLKPGTWLNDEIINFYLRVVQENEQQTLYPFSTFFLPKYRTDGYAFVSKWTKKVDIFSYKYLAFPVHLKLHWTLVIVDLKQKAVTYYDSLNGSKVLSDENKETIDCILQYLQEEHLSKKMEVLPVPWSKTLSEDVPLQENGDDCGVFVCLYASYLSRGKSLFYKGHANTSMIRRKIVYELYSGCLLP